MEPKSKEEIVKEKKEIISELEAQIALSTDLFQNMTAHYGELYAANNAKVNSQHITGFSSLLNSISNMQKQKNDILNEINLILAVEEEEDIPDDTIGNKGQILDLLKDGTN